MAMLKNQRVNIIDLTSWLQTDIGIFLGVAIGGDPKSAFEHINRLTFCKARRAFFFCSSTSSSSSWIVSSWWEVPHGPQGCRMGVGIKLPHQWSKKLLWQSSEVSRFFGVISHKNSWWLFLVICPITFRYFPRPIRGNTALSEGQSLPSARRSQPQWLDCDDFQLLSLCLLAMEQLESQRMPKAKNPSQLSRHLLFRGDTNRATWLNRKKGPPRACFPCCPGAHQWLAISSPKWNG